MYSSTQISRELADEMTRERIELVVGQLANITLQSTLLINGGCAVAGSEVACPGGDS